MARLICILVATGFLAFASDAGASIVFAPNAEITDDGEYGSTAFISTHVPEVQTIGETLDVTGALLVRGETINNLPGVFGISTLRVRQRFFVGPDAITITPSLDGNVRLITSPPLGGVDATTVLWEYQAFVVDVDTDALMAHVGSPNAGGFSVSYRQEANQFVDYDGNFVDDVSTILLPGTYEINFVISVLEGGGESPINALLEFHPDLGQAGFRFDLNLVALPDPAGGALLLGVCGLLLRRHRPALGAARSAGG